MASPATSFREWLDERFPLDEIKALAQKKKVPQHRFSSLVFSRRYDFVPLRSAGYYRRAAVVVLPARSR